MNRSGQSVPRKRPWQRRDWAVLERGTEQECRQRDMPASSIGRISPLLGGFISIPLAFVFAGKRILCAAEHDDQEKWRRPQAFGATFQTQGRKSCMSVFPPAWSAIPRR